APHAVERHGGSPPTAIILCRAIIRSYGHAKRCRSRGGSIMRRRCIAAAVLVAVLVVIFGLPAVVEAGPYPPVDQKRPPLVLKSHGIFWAGGKVVNRTQSGTENAGDLKDLPYSQQQVLAGQ